MSYPARRQVLFGVAVFSSAVLLLLVQPMLTKAILPWFGGTAGVWTTSMLFYQCVLLLGYLYAHLLVQHCSLRSQALIHVVLLSASLLLLPLQPSDAWKPATGDAPLLHILGLLLSTVGLPYFVLSATSPLLQSWYSQTEGNPAPYRLFAVSNLGSLLALLSYPVLLEPFFRTRSQLTSWSLAYAAAVALIAALAWRSFRSPVQAAGGKTTISVQVWLTIALAAVPSVLWLALANHLSQDIAAVPFLWVLPLAIYLSTFALAFDSDRWYRPKLFRILLPFALAGLLFGIALQQFVHFRLFLLFYAIELFIICLFCHGELARRRPETRELTAYYLAIAAGGALGGIFVAIVAPYVFNVYLELPLGALAAIILALGTLYGMSAKRVSRVGGTAAAAVVASFFVDSKGLSAERNFRNFYGTLQVRQSGTMDRTVRALHNGSIEHGLQFQAASLRQTPTTYYGPASGVAVAIAALQHPGMRVGVIGLGVGTLAAYGRPGDYYRFFEINPLVIHLANADFGYLRESAAKCEIAKGDARLSLEREPPEHFDVLAVDAFSGDAIPIHLLTREAFAQYFRHLRPEGALAIHVTNKHLNLAPVVQAIADSYHVQALAISNMPEIDRGTHSASWVLVTGNLELARRLQSFATPVQHTGPLWTDDYSNLLRVLK